MIQLQLFQIDAFADEVFRGNPAAVCPLEKWLDDRTLQQIAAENNLAETAFWIPHGRMFHLRWFTPLHEVPLCGHATLAAAFVIFTEIHPERRSVHFHSQSGQLQVKRQGEYLMMDFPSFRMKPCSNPPENLYRGLGQKPRRVFSVDSDPNYYAVFSTEAEVHAVEPDLGLLEKLHPYGVVITAPGNRSDCVSRYFAPSYGIPEDPVTGSIHCALVPYWAERLHKTEIQAYQASRRGGQIYCENRADRVLLGGRAVKYLEGRIYV